MGLQHRINPPVTKSKRVTGVTENGDRFEFFLHATCFPNDKVLYTVEYISIPRGLVLRIEMRIGFYIGNRFKDDGKKAVFFSDSPFVRGIPQGPTPHSGVARVSFFQTLGVDDFRIRGACSQRR